MSVEDTAGRCLGEEADGFSVEAGFVASAARFEGVGHGEGEAGEGLPFDGGLGFGQEQGDVELVGSVEAVESGCGSIESGGPSLGTGSLNGAVECSGAGDEQAEGSRFET